MNKVQTVRFLQLFRLFSCIFISEILTSSERHPYLPLFSFQLALIRQGFVLTPVISAGIDKSALLIHQNNANTA